MNNKRPKPITLTVERENDKKTYILDFNRRSIEFAENRGFSIEDADSKPVSFVYGLFYYSFLAHQRWMTKDQTDAIIDKIFGGIAGIPEGLLERLGDLYSYPIISLQEDDIEKNAKATVEM